MCVKELRAPKRAPTTKSLERPSRPSVDSVNAPKGTHFECRTSEEPRSALRSGARDEPWVARELDMSSDGVQANGKASASRAK